MLRVSRVATSCLLIRPLRPLRREAGDQAREALGEFFGIQLFFGVSGVNLDVCCRALELATMPSLWMHTKHGVVRRRARHDGAAQAARKWRPLTDGIFKRAIPVAGNHCPFEDPLAVGAKRHADCSIGFALTEALRRAIMGVPATGSLPRHGHRAGLRRPAAPGQRRGQHHRRSPRRVGRGVRQSRNPWDAPAPSAGSAGSCGVIGGSGCS
jgi:hypothetical protein